MSPPLVSPTASLPFLHSPPLTSHQPTSHPSPTSPPPPRNLLAPLLAFHHHLPPSLHRRTPPLPRPPLPLLLRGGEFHTAPRATAPRGISAAAASGECRTATEWAFDAGERPRKRKRPAKRRARAPPRRVAEDALAPTSPARPPLTPSGESRAETRPAPTPTSPPTHRRRGRARKRWWGDGQGKRRARPRCRAQARKDAKPIQDAQISQSTNAGKQNENKHGKGHPPREERGASEGGDLSPPHPIGR